MGSVGSPQAWVPYDNIKDCSQGFCSSYCPQWCYIIFPPPPPYDFMDEGSNPHFSPLVIAIIGILASAFLLASYYILISKYCGRNRESQGTGNRDPNEEFDENGESMNNEQWQALTGGLDETLIKSITVCKYKKGDGFVEETDCSVCLNEFQEDEKVRLLPKCSHAFHLSCIDTWLRAHSNCPLCRANIVISSPLPLQVLSPVHESLPEDEPSQETRNENDAVVAEEAPERDDWEEDSQGRDDVPKTHSRASSDLGQLEQRDTIIEIREESIQPIRRSVSMDYCQSQISIADILEINQDDDSELEDNQVQMDVGSLKPRGEHSKSSNKSRALHCVMTPITMKRSFSSGRLFFTRNGRGRNTMIPL